MSKKDKCNIKFKNRKYLETQVHSKMFNLSMAISNVISLYNDLVITMDEYTDAVENDTGEEKKFLLETITIDETKH